MFWSPLTHPSFRTCLQIKFRDVTVSFVLLLLRRYILFTFSSVVFAFGARNNKKFRSVPTQHDTILHCTKKRPQNKSNPWRATTGGGDCHFSSKFPVKRSWFFPTFRRCGEGLNLFFSDLNFWWKNYSWMLRDGNSGKNLVVSVCDFEWHVTLGRGRGSW